MVEVTATQQQPATAGNNAKPVEKPRISCDYPGNFTRLSRNFKVLLTPVEFRM
jgi:hypothetical protein